MQKVVVRNVLEAAEQLPRCLSQEKAMGDSDAHHTTIDFEAANAAPNLEQGEFGQIDSTFDILSADEQDAWTPFLEEQCRVLTTSDASKLDKLLKEFSKDVSVRNSTLYCSMPILALFRSRLFLAAMFLISCFYFALLGNELHRMMRGDRLSATEVRFTALDTWGTSRPANVAGLANVSLTLDGCGVSPSNITFQDSSLTLSFSNPVEFTGWRFVTVNDHRFVNVSRVRIEAAASPAAAFTTIGCPVSDFGFARTEVAEWNLPLPSAAGEQFEFLFRRPVTLAIADSILCAILAFVGVAAGCLGARGRIMAARAVVCGGVAVLGGLSFVALCALVARREWDAAFQWAPRLLAAAALAPAAASPAGERALPWWLGVLAGGCAGLLVARTAAAKAPLEWVLRSHELWLSGLAGLVGLGLWGKRRRVLAEVLAGVRQDKGRYDEAWARVLSEAAGEGEGGGGGGEWEEGEGEGEVGELEEAVGLCVLQAGKTKKPVQRVPRAASEGGLGAGGGGEMSRLASMQSNQSESGAAVALEAQGVFDRSKSWSASGGSQPGGVAVQSLDQLYAQAEGVQRMLQEKVRRLMEGSEGMLALEAEDRGWGGASGEVEYVAWSAIRRDEALLARAKWAPLKPPHRAVEKVAHHYHGDVSRLTDVCRELVVFRRLRHIAAFLRGLAADEDIGIEMVRSTLTPRHDAALSAGFRCVVVKLRVVSPLAVTFGLHCHVAELLLVPERIANTMCGAAHDKYLHLRELRDFQESAAQGFLPRLTARLRRLAPSCLPPAPSRSSRDHLLPSRRNSAPTPRAASATSSAAPRNLNTLIASLHFSPPSGLPARPPSQPISRPAPAFLMPRTASAPVLRSPGPPPSRTVSNPPPARPRGAREAGEESGRGRGSGLGGRLGRVLSTGASLSSSSRSLARTTSLYSQVSLSLASAWGRVGSALTASRVDSSIHSLEASSHGPAPSEAEGRASALQNLVALYRRRTAETPGTLDREVSEIKVAVEQAEPFSVFATSFPIAAAMCKPAFLLPLLLVAAAHLAAAALSLSRLASAGPVLASALRLAPLAPPSPSASEAWARGAWAFGVLRGGCRQRLSPSESDPLLFTLDHPSALHGLYIAPAPNTPLSAPPLALSVLALQPPSPGAAPEWVPLGPSRFTLDGDLRRAEGPLLRLPGGGGGWGGVEAEVRAPWAVWAGVPGSSLALGVAWLGVAACALCGWVRAGRGMVLSGLGAAAVLRAVGAVGCQVGGVADIAAAHWATPALLLAAWGVVAVREQRLLEAMAGLGGGNVVVRAVLVWCGEAGSEAEGAYRVLGEHVEWAVLAGVAAGLLAARAVGRRQAKLAIEEDIRAYDAAWRALEAGEGAGGGAIEGMQALCAEVREAAEAGAQPLLQTFLAPPADRASRFGRPLSPRDRSPRRTRSPCPSRPSRRASLSPKPRTSASSLGEPASRKLPSDLRYSSDPTPSASPVALSRPERFSFRVRQRPPPAASSGSRRPSRESSGSASPSRSVSAAPQPSFRRAATDNCLLPSPSHPITISAPAGPLSLRPSSPIPAPSPPASTSRDAPGSDPSGSPLSAWRLPLEPAHSPDAPPLSPPSTPEPPRSQRTLRPRVRPSSLKLLQSSVTLDDPVPLSPSHPTGLHPQSPAESALEPPLRSLFNASAGSLPSPSSLPGLFLPFQRVSSSGTAASALTASSSRPSLRHRLAAAPHPQLRAASDGWRLRSTESSPSSSFVTRVMSTIPYSPLGALLRSRSRCEPDSLVRVVASLDQLYAQAAVLYPVLKRKVQHWALGSEGMFPVGDKGRHRYLLWSELAGRGMGSEVRWAQLKGPQRAIEKLSRSYQGRVGCLLDVCRQSIVFETPAALLGCLTAIDADPEVTLVKITNRFDPQYASRKSLGYRDVNLNLRIDTEETRRLGVDLHICEVQLLLRTFADLKSNEGHKRYVAFRNARGE